MRTLWLLIAALLAFAGAIHAQVAAPRPARNRSES